MLNHGTKLLVGSRVFAGVYLPRLVFIVNICNVCFDVCKNIFFSSLTGSAKRNASELEMLLKLRLVTNSPLDVFIILNIFIVFGPGRLLTLKLLVLLLISQLLLSYFY